MYKRVLKVLRVLLRGMCAGALLILAGAAILIACNCRDAPPPPPGNLELAAPIAVSIDSNGWFFIREAVRQSWVPARTNSLSLVWYGVRHDAAGIRELLAPNQSALIWVDRAANCSRIAQPYQSLPEDGNWLEWSPVARCGRLLRLRAELALIEGHTNAAMHDYGQSLRLARLYLDCPPAGEPDALAAFAEVRNAVHALRDASKTLEARLLWDRFGSELQELSDLRAARDRAAAAAWAADRRELARLQRIAAGAELICWDSPFSSFLPNAEQLAAEGWIVNLVFKVLNLLPVSYRLHPNRTLAIMADVRRGGPLPPSVHQAINARRFASIWELLGPACRLLGPNGLGELYIIFQAERQEFIEGGLRLAECATRGTRLAFALRQYEQEHGELPEQLAALVPAWCAAVPTDPYNGQPFLYDRTRRLVYSVGPNRRDDGGLDDVLFQVFGAWRKDGERNDRR